MVKKRQFFMDTNVFISSLKSDDPYFEDAKKIVKELKEGEIYAEASSLVILEVASVSSRFFMIGRRKRSKVEVDEPVKKLRSVFVIRALKRLNSLKIKYVNIAGDAAVSIKGIQAIVPSIMNEGIILSLECSLRTLDLIHLAAARYAKRMNTDIDAFVTGDKDFLMNRKELFGILEIPIMSPKEYVETFGIGKSSSHQVRNSS